MPRILSTALVLALFAGPAPAAIVVMTNATDQPVTFEISHPPGPAVAVRLAAFETRAVPVGRQPQFAYRPAGADPVQFALDPYSAYAFVPTETGTGFQGVELAAPLPKPDDLPAAPAATAPLRVQVKVYADLADPRTRPTWERAYRARVAEASAVLEKQANVTLDVVGVGQWPVDDGAEDLPAAFKDFERKVKAGPDAALVIGFTPRPLGYAGADKGAGGEAFGTVRGPFATHLLLRDGVPRTAAERAEVLVHHLGTWLGAAGAADGRSVMRPRLGDGQAARAKFAIQFDPLNLVAVHLWADELRTGKVRAWADLSPMTRDRLTVIYKTLAAANPKDMRAADHLDALARLAEPAARVAAAPDPPAPAGKPMPKAADAAPAPAPDPRDDKRAATRQVVRAITVRARDIRDRPAADRPRGDKLTNELVRAAADVAATAGGPDAAGAFLIGLGIGLDDSTILRDNLITRDMVRVVETDAERQERLAVLGRPSVRGRRDLCQHFAVSAALTEIVGAKGAELAGLTKEVKDLGGDSGFSFVDLAADLAGIAFAQKLLADKGHLGKLRDTFDTEAAVPPTTGLREGLTPKRFEADYGGLSDERFQAALADVRKRVAEHGK